MVDPFEALGLEPTASVEQVKRRWQELASQYHPDHGGDAETFHSFRMTYMQALERAQQPKKCQQCNGEGRTRVNRGFSSIWFHCRACNGKGKVL